MLILKEKQTPVAARLLFRSPMLFRAEKKSLGSPGSTVFSRRAWNQIVCRLRLSRREAEIVRGVFDDKTEYAIAAELGISSHTVHTHFERLHEKLGVADRVQLVLCIMQEFLRLRASPGSQAPSISGRWPQPP
jgi:DNA-binding NarL/FixJ family response regulator